FEQMEDGLVDQILTIEASRVAQHVAADPQFLPAQGARELGVSMRAWLQDGAAGGNMPSQLNSLPPRLHLLEPGAETWHVMVADTSRGRLYVLYDATDHEARVRDFGLIVLGMGALCIMAACEVMLLNAELPGDIRHRVARAQRHRTRCSGQAGRGVGGDGSLELRDTDKGILAEELPFVFQRYYSGRLNDAPATTPDDDGGFPRGLGLAIAKRVCDMQGWRLQVESEREGVRRGTCF